MIKNMTVYDLLKNYREIKNIEVRTNSPIDTEADILFGYCKWNGKELISLDGDNYYLDDEVYNYHIWLNENNDYNLTYWFRSNWIKG